MLIVLDCDDVLYECNKMACERLNAEYGTSYNIQDIHSWGKTGSVLDNRMEYFKDPDFIGNLPVFDGAKEFVHCLSLLGEIVIATNVAASCADARVKSIRRNFPEIKIENILIGGRKDLLNADFMLDDAIHHIKDAKHVKYPVLFRKPWNKKGADMFLSVSSYGEFINMIKEGDFK